mgnify:CR=1 FL=1
MSTHEYPDGYRVRILDKDVTLEKIAEFFRDTGQTGDDALSWLDTQQAQITEAFEQPLPVGQEARGYYESKLSTDHDAVELRQTNFIGQQLVRKYLEERRLSPVEPMPVDEHTRYADVRLLTLARPDIQRLDRSRQKSVLQHEVWTEAERLWLVAQLLDAKGYTPDPERDKAYDTIDETLASLDGMSMAGLAEWSHPLRELQQRFTIAKGANDKIAMLENTKQRLNITDNISSMSIDELVALRDKQVWRINAEVMTYKRGDGPGTPSDKLCEQIRWTELMLDFNFGVTESGEAVEALMRDRLDKATVAYTADIMHLLPLVQGKNADYAFSLNLGAAVRGTASLEAHPALFSSRRRMEYTDLEAYLSTLWEVGERLGRDSETALASQHVGQTAYHSASQELEPVYAFAR